MPSLTPTEAATRAAALTVRSYDVDLDLTTGDRTFASTTRIVFAATADSTFADVKPDALSKVTLNGVPVDVGGLEDGRLPLTGLALDRDNELVVTATMAYTNSGEGLHRSVDATDGRAYLYAMGFLDASPQVFACFDQPDLKAPYRFRITAPEDWVVVGNGAAAQVTPGRWELAETRPLSTYFVTLVAGPYHHLRSEHDGIPLGLLCRQSLAEHLDREADDLFTVTGQAFDEFHRLFGYRYPFGEYHQAFVPELNAGAMENPGCVTFRDEVVFRSAVTDGERSTRARTVVHEMAHMWFGDTVTMRWWNDLWLNESFAEYMAYRVSTTATRYVDNWTDFAFVRKWWGLQADQRTSTHPVASEPGKDALASLDDFDGISYAKGAATLKQLVAYLGDDTFLAGVRAHIASNEFGNATLADLLAKWAAARGGDPAELDRWAQAWLRTPGVDTIRAERIPGGVRLHRTAPAGHPARRPHKLTIGGYDATGAGERIPVLLDADSVDVELPGEPAVIVPDAGDDTWAKTRLDEQSLARLADVLPRLADTETRAVVWNGLRDAVENAELDPRVVFDVLCAALPHEDSDIAVGALLSWTRLRMLGGFLPVEPFTGRLADVLAARLPQARAGRGLQLALARGLIATSSNAGLLRGWLAGTGVPDGLAIDTDLRWLVTLRLSRLGAIDGAGIDAELARDKSSEGIVHATRCRAALADPAAKDRAWALIATDAEVANYELYAACEGFWHPAQLDVTAPYVDRYFAEIAGTAKLRTGWVVGRTATLAFPRTFVDESVVAQAEALAADDAVGSGIRRAVGDEADDLRRVLAVRRAFP
jgi:aminopeptidase N